MTCHPSTTVQNDWHALVATHAAAQERLRISNLTEPTGTDEENDALTSAEWAAWEAVMHAPAPDLTGMAYKLRLLLNLHIDHPGDAHDSLPFLQRLLDDKDVEGGFPVVRLMQDALRFSGEVSPVVSLTRSEDKPWPELVAVFKEAHAYINRPDSDEVTDQEAENFNPIRDAVYYYPVATLAELSQKLALIKMGDGGDERGFEAIAEDIERLNGSMVSMEGDGRI